MLEKGIYQLQKTLGLCDKYYTEKEYDDKVVIKIAVPGAMEEEEFKITANSERIKVAYCGNEFCSSFLYVYRFNTSFNKLTTSAVLENGILTIVLPKN